MYLLLLRTLTGVPVVTEDTDWCVFVITEDTDWCVCVCCY